MSTENFDHGSNKASGRVELAANAAGSTVRGEGMGPAVLESTGLVTLNNLEGIAEAEFLCVTGLDNVDGQVCATWVDDNHFTLEISDEAGVAADGAAWFVLYRAATEAVAITDAPGE